MRHAHKKISCSHAFHREPTPEEEAIPVASEGEGAAHAAQPTASVVVSHAVSHAVSRAGLGLRSLLMSDDESSEGEASMSIGQGETGQGQRAAGPSQRSGFGGFTGVPPTATPIAPHTATSIAPAPAPPTAPWWQQEPSVPGQQLGGQPISQQQGQTILVPAAPSAGAHPPRQPGKRTLWDLMTDSSDE